MAELEAKDRMAPVPKKTLGEWLRPWLDTAADRWQPKRLERYQLAAYILDAPEGAVRLSDVCLAELSHMRTRTGRRAAALPTNPATVEFLRRAVPFDSGPSDDSEIADTADQLLANLE